jgi:hypothetical protein
VTEVPCWRQAAYACGPNPLTFPTHGLGRAGISLLPPCRIGTPASGCRLPQLWRLVPIPLPPIHLLHPLPRPPPPLPTSPHAATPSFDAEPRRRRCWCAPEDALAAASPMHARFHWFRWCGCCAPREMKNHSEAPPSTPLWLPLRLDMMRRPLVRFQARLRLLPRLSLPPRCVCLLGCMRKRRCDCRRSESRVCCMLRFAARAPMVSRCAGCDAVRM